MLFLEFPKLTGGKLRKNKAESKRKKASEQPTKTRKKEHTKQLQCEDTNLVKVVASWGVFLGLF